MWGASKADLIAPVSVYDHPVCVAFLRGPDKHSIILVEVQLDNPFFEQVHPNKHTGNK